MSYAHKAFGGKTGNATQSESAEEQTSEMEKCSSFYSTLEITK